MLSLQERIIGNMELSPAGLGLIERVEGAKLEMYRDQAGLPTIGVGHKLTQSELSSGKLNIGGMLCNWRVGLSEGEVKSLLEQDVASAARAVGTVVTVPLTQPQFDALVSMCFNIGNEAFTHSTLVKTLNQGDYAGVPLQMRRWIYSGGIILQVLIMRREAEITRWLSAN